ncbi:MAG: ORF6N domain-containing protein [Bacteroidales bacterium]|nr:ORF6N domain-containing protein [Bacteroidales bacterium]MDT8431113.1 ORF6N domain-containing protein [Bacteroidales bacterium]
MVNSENSLINEKIDRAILIIRGHGVMIDSDLAEFFGVKTKNLNEQVKRNFSRFPKDFMFQLTSDAKQELVANCDHLEKLKHSATNPYAFTEHGTIMLANVLNTQMAVETSVLIVRVFVRLRELFSSNKELERKILELESKYDKQFELIFKAIKELMRQEQLDKNRPRIGYAIGKGE